jgi:Tfp pilus assembly protein PilE
MTKIRPAGWQGFRPARRVVFLVIVGVLAAFGIARFLRSIERSKAAEAFAYLLATRKAQDRYHARERTYADTIVNLDLRLIEPRYFAVGSIGAGSTGSLRSSWSLTLTRSGSPAGYGPYTVTFTQDGFDPVASTIVRFPDLVPP